MQAIEEIDFPPEYFTSEARDLISKCLQKDQVQRITCEEALKHPIFCEQVKGALGVVKSFRSLASGQAEKYRKEILEEPSLANSVRDF